jgi:hypothetical protein
MEEESIQKTDGADAQPHCGELAKELTPEGRPTDKTRTEQRGMRWPVWLLAILILLLLGSSIANLVVSQRAYESSHKQIKAIEQLTQSIKDIQRSVMTLSRMLEQSSPEDQELEEDGTRGAAADGSI